MILPAILPKTSARHQRHQHLSGVPVPAAFPALPKPQAEYFSDLTGTLASSGLTGLL